MAPRSVRRTAGLPDWPTGPLPAVRVAEAVPAPDEHRARVRRAREQLTARAAPCRRWCWPARCGWPPTLRWTPASSCAGWSPQDPAAYGYLVDLTAAGGRVCGHGVGGRQPGAAGRARRRPGDVSAVRRFGAARRRPRTRRRRRRGAGRVGQGPPRASTGRRHHGRRPAAAVQRADNRADTPTEPHHGAMASQHTDQRRLRDTSTTAIDLALALHPTPAVGGVPTERRRRTDRRTGGRSRLLCRRRRLVRRRGDGRWVVSIRCAQLSADRRTALAHAGGGIVAESDPDDEVAETTTKFVTILTALGVPLMSERIRRAMPADAAAITAMIHALADFERAADQCTVTETQICTALFGEPTTLRAHVAEVDGEVAAMALWFVNFSTWDGVEGIYFEDLYVRPRFRRLRAGPRRCSRRWPGNAWTTATPGCPGRC